MFFNFLTVSLFFVSDSEDSENDFDSDDSWIPDIFWAEVRRLNYDLFSDRYFTIIFYFSCICVMYNLMDEKVWARKKGIEGSL